MSVALFVGIYFRARVLVLQLNKNLKIENIHYAGGGGDVLYQLSHDREAMVAHA